MSKDHFQTAGELSADLPFSEEYIRAAMNHPDFETIGRSPSFATYDDAISFFKTHPEFRIRSVYQRSEGVRTI